jgi:hypothetical protein
MLNVLLPMLQGHPKVKAVIEQTFGQPVDHVTGCFGAFLENVKKGPGLVNSAEQKLTLFNHIYHGGLSLGFADWESEFAAAKIAGYTDLDICRSFRERHNWPQTRIEDMPAIEANVMPRFLPKAKAAGLLPPEMFPESGLPTTNITTTGGAAPWESLTRSGAGAAAVNNTAPEA